MIYAECLFRDQCSCTVMLVARVPLRPHVGAWSLLVYIFLQLGLHRAAEAHHTGQVLQLQAAEKAARDAQLHKLYDDNPPSPEYFGQFQTSHR